MKKFRNETEAAKRARGCVKSCEIHQNARQIGVVHPEEYDEQEIWWDTTTGNIYIEIRDYEYEESLDCFGIKHGRQAEWFGYIGNCTGDRMEAETMMQELIENAELL